MWGGILPRKAVKQDKFYATNAAIAAKVKDQGHVGALARKRSENQKAG